MISDRSGHSAPNEAYVWIWLPGATEPVVAGRLFLHPYIFEEGADHLAARLDQA